MKYRTAFDLVFCLLVAMFVILIGTVLQAGADPSGVGLLMAQRQTPALWVLDVCALLLGAQIAFSTIRHRIERTRQARLREEHLDQLEATLSKAKYLEEVNAAQADQISTLQVEVRTRREAFEAEARRLTEQAFRALSGQVDASARQLDAVNMALQYHRSELQQLRHGMRSLQTGPNLAQIARLSPGEMAAILEENTQNASSDEFYSRDEEKAELREAEDSPLQESVVISGVFVGEVASSLSETGPEGQSVDTPDEEQTASADVKPAQADATEDLTPGFFHPTLNAPATVVSLSEFEVEPYPGLSETENEASARSGSKTAPQTASSAGATKSAYHSSLPQASNSPRKPQAASHSDLPALSPSRWHLRL